MAELIAAGTSQANSADFTIAAGASNTFYIKPPNGISAAAPSGVTFVLQHKTPNGDYDQVATFDSTNTPAVVSGAGTYRMQRQVTSNAAGMDIE